MNIEMVGREMHPSDTLRARIESKLAKFSARLDPNAFARVRFGREGKDQYACTVSFNTVGSQFTASATATDLFRAADETIAKLSRQIERLPRHTYA